MAGREDRIANAARARDWDYVIGSVHFLRDRASTSGASTSGAAASRPRRSGSATSRRSPRRPRTGLYDIMAHPDLVKVWGGAAPRPEGDLRRYYEPAIEAFAEVGVAVEVSTAGLRKPVGEIYPSRPFLEMVVDAGCPIALSSDAHVPEQLGHGYEERARAARRRRHHASCACSRAASGGWSRSADPAPASGSTRHRFEPGRPLILGGVDIPHEAGPRGHSDADVLTHAIIDALLGAAGLGDIGQHFPDTDERCKRRRLDRAAAHGRRAAASAGFAIVHVDATVMMERPKLSPSPRRDARDRWRPRSARTRQRQGDDRRADGLRRPRRGRRGAGGRDAARGPACGLAHARLRLYPAASSSASPPRRSRSRSTPLVTRSRRLSSAALRRAGARRRRRAAARARPGA